MDLDVSGPDENPHKSYSTTFFLRTKIRECGEQHHGGAGMQRQHPTTMATPHAPTFSHRRGRATAILLHWATTIALGAHRAVVGQPVVATFPPTSEPTLQPRTLQPTQVAVQQTSQPTLVAFQPRTLQPTMVAGQQSLQPTMVAGQQSLEPTLLQQPPDQEDPNQPIPLCEYFEEGVASVLDYSDKCGAEPQCHCGIGGREDGEGAYYSLCTDATLQCSMTSPKVCGNQTAMVDYDDAETYRVTYNWTYVVTTDGSSSSSSQSSTTTPREETLQYVYNPANECSLSIDNPRWGNTTWCNCFFQPCQNGELKPFVDCTNYEENATANWCYYGLGVQKGSVLEGLVVTLSGQCEAVAIAAAASKQRSITIVVVVLVVLVAVTALGVVYGCWIDRRRAAAKQKLLNNCKTSVGRSSRTNPTLGGGDVAPIRAEVPAQPDGNDRTTVNQDPEAIAVSQPVELQSVAR